MRRLIQTGTIILFALAAIVMFKALGIPDSNSYYQSNTEVIARPQPSQTSKDELERIEKEQYANRVLVEELQATIANLEDKLLTEKQDSPKSAVAINPERTSRTLAVFGGDTFQSGQIVINENLMNTVKELVQDILSSPGYRVIIEGHTDNIPIRSSKGNRYIDNMELSFLRAKAVAKVLVEEGVSTERISVIGYGDTRPKTSNDTKEDRAKNRRVEVKLVPDDKEL